jgi:AraC-like DNA-binding protein
MQQVSPPGIDLRLETLRSPKDFAFPNVPDLCVGKPLSWYKKVALHLSPRAADTVQRSLACMSQHLAGHVSMDELCKRAGLSASHLFPLFRSATGYSPIQFFIRMKMHLACHLLVETNCSIREIGVRIGYSDPGHFSRAFKSVVGLPPGEYRANRSETHKAKVLPTVQSTADRS